MQPVRTVPFFNLYDDIQITQLGAAWSCRAGGPPPSKGLIGGVGLPPVVSAGPARRDHEVEGWVEEPGRPQPPPRNIRPAGLTTFRSDSGSRPGSYAAPPAQSQARVPRGLPTPTNSHLFQPRLTKSREFSGRPTRGNSRIEGTRPVRSGLPPPPSSPADLDREETRTGFPYGFRGFCQSRVQHETRATRRIVGPDLGSRFPRGAVAPTRGPVRAVVGLQAADSRACGWCS